ncbi:MAG: arginine--tRNA ligase [Thermincolia bacterium]
MANIIDQVKQGIIAAITKAVEDSRAAEELEFQELPNFVLEVPREKAHGDFATNIAMLLTKQAKKSPRQIAETVIPRLATGTNWIQRVEIAGPGFINFYLDPAWVYQILPLVEERDEEYGQSNVGNGRQVQVEFVSANPTGLLHMGNARGAALGDTITALLGAAGFAVTREFYINDTGNQIENFGKSLEARYLQQLGMDVPFPEEGYHGQDIIETVKNIIAKDGDKYVNMEVALRREMLIKFGLDEKLAAIGRVLESFGVKYDVWFSEQSLHESGAVEQTLSLLRDKGYIYEQEGALWFRSTLFGDDKDEVVVRSNGIPTYFAADIAYHKNKFDRGFDWVINLWGADHHGHVDRMKGSMKAIGYDPDKLDVVLMQLVRLFKGGEIVRMSKRSGEFVTLEDLIEEVGKDAARYFFVMRSSDSHLDFDMDLAKSQSADNPVYYIQYAHARICSILRQAEENGLTVPKVQEVNINLLKETAELELIRKVGDLPEEIAVGAVNLEPHRLARYAHELAGVFHSFYNNCRVMVEDKEMREARMVLVNATRIALRNSLQLLGLTTPERM